MPDRMKQFRPIKATLKKMPTTERRDSVEQKVYATARWHRLRLEVIRDHVQTHGPFCIDCQCPLDFHRGTHVDHIKRHHGINDPLAYDPSNLAVRCVSCHSRKTRAEGSST